MRLAKSKKTFIAFSLALITLFTSCSQPETPSVSSSNSSSSGTNDENNNQQPTAEQKAQQEKAAAISTFKNSVKGRTFKEPVYNSNTLANSQMLKTSTPNFKPNGYEVSFTEDGNSAIIRNTSKNINTTLDISDLKITLASCSLDATGSYTDGAGINTGIFSFSIYNISASSTYIKYLSFLNYNSTIPDDFVALEYVNDSSNNGGGNNNDGNSSFDTSVLYGTWYFNKGQNSQQNVTLNNGSISVRTNISPSAPSREVTYTLSGNTMSIICSALNANANFTVALSNNNTTLTLTGISNNTEAQQIVSYLFQSASTTVTLTK